MNLNVRFKPSASRDVESAFSWYEAEQKGLGHRFIGAIDAALLRIVERPELYKECRPGVRCGLLERFPYMLFYLIEANEVVVLACLHSRRNPRSWPRK